MKDKELKKCWSHKHDYNVGEIWCTYTYIAKDITPRLRAFRSLDKHGVPGIGNMEMRQWNSTIDKMIRAFELIGLDNKALTEQEEEEKQEGFELFCKYFFYLWD